jgi:hypothetical protein
MTKIGDEILNAVTLYINAMRDTRGIYICFGIYL